MVEINGAEFPWADDKYHDPEWVPKVIGKRVRTYDGYAKVTGKAKYSGDIYFPHMLHAKILRAQVAHANVTSIDTSEAEALPGVKAVITHKDRLDQEALESGGYGQRFLVNTVRQYGDPIAAVAAETEEIAEDALDLIEVEYEMLPVNLEYEGALEPGAHVINEVMWPGNICYDRTIGRGDVEEGFMEADRIFEQDYSTGQPPMMEPQLHCHIVKYEDGIFYLWIADQGANKIFGQFSSALGGVPDNKIRIHDVYSGGGYGASVKTGWGIPVTALLAMKTGRPVRLEKDIERETTQGSRSICNSHVKVGIKNDGTLTAMDYTGHYNLGAYGYSGIITWAMASLMNLYKCTNSRLHSTAAITNRSGTSEYRGYGGPHQWPYDALMAEMCEEMDFDPLEWRKKNQFAQFDMVAAKNSDRLGLLTSTGMSEVVDGLADKIDWATEWQAYKHKAATASTIKLGIGMGLGCRGISVGNAHMIVILNSDGTANTITGMGNPGTGSHTAQAACVAEVLELPIEEVTAVWGDSFFIPETKGSSGSHQAVSMSTASRLAAEDILQTLYGRAAPGLGVGPEELEAKDGKIQVKGQPETGILYKDLMGSTENIVGEGENIMMIRNYPPFLDARGLSQYTQAGTCNKVEVDVETGGVNILKTVNAMDVGRALNLNIVEGQVLGGGVTGIGESLMADIIWDPATGVALNTSHVDAMYPLMADTPPIEPVIVESIDAWSAFGTKGIGELPQCGPQSAIIDTIYNAIGVRIRQLPMTPDVILKALGKV